MGKWDESLSELRDDPEVDEAIEAIDSDPPPGPFVRSTPPGAPPASEAAPPQEQAYESDDGVDPHYHEPADVDPPPLTYEQVFESEGGAGIRAPRAVEPTSAFVAADRRPSLFPWVLLLMAAVLGASAVTFVLTQRRDVGAGAGPVAVTDSEPVTVPEPVPAPAPGPEPAPEPETANATVAAPESEPEVPAENPDVIYPETGAPDTYEAQLTLARRLKRGSRATAAYRRAIELNPEGADALAELARLMLARQNTREATELAERATAIDPSNSLAWVTLGAARQMRGDRQGARQAYQSCAKLGRGRYVSECRAMLR
jgi:hypothetical protein